MGRRPGDHSNELFRVAAPRALIASNVNSIPFVFAVVFIFSQIVADLIVSRRS